jgi:hypothetical protein
VNDVTFETQSVCTLDGYIDAGLEVIMDATDDAVAAFDIYLQNQSFAFTYHDNNLAIGLYQSEEATVPVYWSALDFLPSVAPGEQVILSADVDLSQVQSGTYVARVGVHQGDLFAVMRNSLQQQAVELVVAETDPQYSVTLSTRSDADTIRQHSVIASNNTARSVRGFEQHIAVFTGTVAGGSAVLHQNQSPVKMISGGSEETTLTTAIDVSTPYTVIGINHNNNQFLPVVTQLFNTAGTRTVPAVYPVATGVQLDTADQRTIQSVTCLESLGGQGRPVGAVGAQVTLADAPPITQMTEVAAGGGLLVSWPAELGSSTVAYEFYRPVAGTTVGEAAIANEPATTILFSAYQLAVPCDEKCAVQPNEINSLSVTEVGAPAIGGWVVYLALSVIVVLLGIIVFIAYSNRKESSADQEAMHQPE